MGVGALYYETCKNIVRDAEDADKVVCMRQSQSQRQLRIGTSVAFGRHVVVPLALEFIAQFPQVQVDLSFEDRCSDLVATGPDLAVRIGKLADSTLGARHLKKHGTTKRPSDPGGDNPLI